MFIELTRRTYGAEGERQSPICLNTDQIIAFWKVGGMTCIEMKREDESYPYISVYEEYETLKEKLCGRSED